jgi:aspartyl-tRNA(Asn)/glutamyl-tRNA(Gln) amidotransferase subunit C
MCSMAHHFSTTDVQKIATLANIPLTDSQLATLTTAFDQTIEVVDQLQKLDSTNVEPTSQVTGLENVFREDIVDEKRMFTQEQALSNAPRTANGFFVVDAIFNEE